MSVCEACGKKLLRKKPGERPRRFCRRAECLVERRRAHDRAHDRARYMADPEGMKARIEAARTPERKRAYDRISYARNREARIEHNRQWDAAHPENARERALASYHRNRDEINARRRARRAARKPD